MSSTDDQQYIATALIPELLERFNGWSKEYTQERDLGIRGEFVGLYRKTRKLKTIFWDGVDASGWREDERTIIMEVIAHGLLMLVDYDRERRHEVIPELKPDPETFIKALEENSKKLLRTEQAETD